MKPLRAVVNIQHPGMEGTFHSDYGDVTCIYMVTDTLKNKDGALDVDNKIINFDTLILAGGAIENVKLLNNSKSEIISKKLYAYNNKIFYKTKNTRTGEESQPSEQSKS